MEELSLALWECYLILGTNAIVISLIPIAGFSLFVFNFLHD